MPEPQPLEIDASFSMIRWPDKRNGPWGIRANWVMMAGRPECVGLVIWYGADQGYRSPMEYFPHGKKTLRPVTATGIADLPIATIIDRLRQQARAHWREYHRYLTEQIAQRGDEMSQELKDLMAGGFTAFEPPGHHRGAPRRYGVEHYVEVACVYLQAWREQGNPTQAVADYFDVSRSAAAKWVAKTRSPALQLLTPTAHGVAGAAEGPGLIRMAKKKSSKRTNAGGTNG